MDIMAILGNAMDYDNGMQISETEVEYDLSNPMLIRSVYEAFEKPFVHGEQCAIVIDKQDCEINGFRFWNKNTMESEHVYLFDAYEDITAVSERYSYIYKIILRELVHGL